MTQVYRPQALFSVSKADSGPSVHPGPAVHGEVFTRGWIVDFILDLVEYRQDRDLAALRLVEPACGAVAFLEVVARRVSASCRAHGRHLAEAGSAVRAFDLLERNVSTARDRVTAALLTDGWEKMVARRIAREWVRRGDYVLDDLHETPVDVVVGSDQGHRTTQSRDLTRLEIAQFGCTCPPHY